MKMLRRGHLKPYKLQRPGHLAPGTWHLIWREIPLLDEGQNVAPQY
jgi:hypothetical protein